MKQRPEQTQQPSAAYATATEPRVILPELAGRLNRVVDHTARGRTCNDSTQANLEVTLGEYFRLHAVMADRVTRILMTHSGSMEDLTSVMPLVGDLCNVGMNICKLEQIIGQYREEALAVTVHPPLTRSKRRNAKMIPNDHDRGSFG